MDCKKLECLVVDNPESGMWHFRNIDCSIAHSCFLKHNLIGIGGLRTHVRIVPFSPVRHDPKTASARPRAGAVLLDYRPREKLFAVLKASKLRLPETTRPPTAVALLRFRGESTHESVAVPKLNVVAINELFGRFNGGGIVRVIVQKFGSNEIEMPVDTDDVGAIVRHGAAPFD